MSGNTLERASSPPPDLERTFAPARIEPTVSSRRESPARIPDMRSSGFASALEAAREGGVEHGGSAERGTRVVRADATDPALEKGVGGEQADEVDDEVPELPPGARPQALVNRPGVSDGDALGTDPRESAGGVSGSSAAAPLSASSAVEPPVPPSGAGATAPALDVAAIGTLMSDLRALDAPPSAQWRFSMPGNADGLNSLVLSRGESGAWNLKLGTERGRGVSRGELDSLRGALRERGHEVDRISHDIDDGAT